MNRTVSPPGLLHRPRDSATYHQKLLRCVFVALHLLRKSWSPKYCRHFQTWRDSFFFSAHRCSYFSLILFRSYGNHREHIGAKIKRTKKHILLFIMSWVTNLGTLFFISFLIPHPPLEVELHSQSLTFFELLTFIRPFSAASFFLGRQEDVEPIPPINQKIVNSWGNAWLG